MMNPSPFLLLSFLFLFASPPRALLITRIQIIRPTSNAATAQTTETQYSSDSSTAPRKKRNTKHANHCKNQECKIVFIRLIQLKYSTEQSLKQLVIRNTDNTVHY